MSVHAPAVHLAAIVLKATAILLAGALLATLARRAPARVPHGLWTAVLAGVLVLPALHLAVPARTPAWLRVGSLDEWTAPSPVRTASVRVPAAPAPLANPPAAPVPDRSTPMPWGAVLLAAWACGAVVIGGRGMAGVCRRRRMARMGEAGEDDGCRERLRMMAARLGMPPPWLRTLPGAVPATWGVLRPVIVLPVSARAWPAARLDAVLHHELAHVRRRDALWCGVGEWACAVFWFHPGVWLARRAALRAQEQAADDLVLRTGGERFSYARALVETARLYAHPSTDTAPAFFRGRSELASRLRRLTHAHASRAARWPVGALPLALAAAVAFVAPLRPAAAVGSPPREAAGPTPRIASPMPRTPVVGAPALASTRPASAVASSAHTDPQSAPAAAADDTAGAYRRAMAAAGLRGVSPAMLRRLWNLGVTPAYVRQMRDAGLRLQSGGEAVSLWVQGVTPAFVAQVRGAGMPLEAPADAVELWIHKVPAAFVSEMADAGVDVSRAAPIRRLHNHGVRPAYVTGLARAGLPLRQPADVLEMHIHHVPAEFVAALASTGLRGLTAREARRLHNFGIDPRDPAQIRTVSGYDRALARVPSLLPG